MIVIILLSLTMFRGDGVLIEVDGINGMQPNQDWPNAYIIEARRETFHYYHHHHHPLSSYL